MDGGDGRNASQTLRESQRCGAKRGSFHRQTEVIGFVLKIKSTGPRCDVDIKTIVTNMIWF